MAKVVNVNLGIGNPSHVYQWRTWADGRTWKLVRGEDYTETMTMVSAGRKYARDHGLKLRTQRIPEEDAMLIQFVPRPEHEIEIEMMTNGEGSFS